MMSFQLVSKAACNSLPQMPSRRRDVNDEGLWRCTCRSFRCGRKPGGVWPPRRTCNRHLERDEEVKAAARLAGFEGYCETPAGQDDVEMPDPAEGGGGVEQESGGQPDDNRQAAGSPEHASAFEEEGSGNGDDNGFSAEDLELLDRVADLYKYGAQASFSNNDFSWLLQWGFGPTRSIAAALDPEWQTKAKESRAPASHDQAS
jgi:hypothetical protein